MLMNVDTPEWRAVTGLTTQQQTPSPEFYEEQQEQRYDSWMRAASRHAKIVALVRGLASDDCCASCGPNNNRFDSEQMSDLKQQQQQQLPFHPLHCAASQGMTTAGRLLLQWYSSNNQECLSALVNTHDAAMGCTPLHWAAITNRVDFMRMLLDHGAEVNSRDHEGRTPLFSCAAFGAIDATSLLLERQADHHRTDRRGLTPLHAAAAGGHLEVAQELVSAGADVRRRAVVGATPRHIAEKQGHASVVELLAAAARRSPEEKSANAMMSLEYYHKSQAAGAGGGGHGGHWLLTQLRTTVEGTGRRSMAA